MSNRDVAPRLRALDERVKELEGALGGLIRAYESNTGHEPSLSVLHRAIDIAKATFNEVKP